MGALAVVVCLAASALVFGFKLFAIFGLVVAAATFMFPCGLAALVAFGVALLFVLTPRHRLD